MTAIDIPSPAAPSVSAAPNEDEAIRLDRAMAYIQEHYADAPTLEVLGKVAKMSPFFFHRRFKARFGITAKVAVTNRQIDAIKTLLKNGVPLPEIAARTGFSHQSHLTARFKQLVGATPAQWLKQ